MKKSLIAIALFAACGAAMASSPVCEMKRTQQEYNQCYQLSVNGGLARMKENYRRIKMAPNVPKEEKDYIDPAHEEWAKVVEGKCRDLVCMYGSISQRNNEIEQYMRSKGLRPI